MGLVIIVFLALLFLGMPVAFAIAIAGVTFFFQHPELPMTMIVQQPISQTQNSAMLAIPLFILAGNIMNAGGITTRLVKFASVLTRNMRGGMAQSSVVLSALMGGVSGSATADAAMEARLLGPSMEKAGYERGYTSNAIAWTSLITATIPPGIGIIIYGTVGEVSIGRLFMCGLFMGLLMMVILMVTVSITCKKYGFQSEKGGRASGKEIWDSLKECIWALFFPILLLVGIRLGLFTPSEVGSFACVYGLIVGAFIYKELNWKTLWNSFKVSMVDIGAIMLIIAMSGSFGYGIPFEQVPQKLTAFMLNISSNKYIIMILIVFVLTILGMFMEGSVTILLLTPIFLPLVKSLGVDPVHFGLIMCTTVTMGLNTPPVGISMYATNQILDTDMNSYIKYMWPFLIAVVLEILAMIFAPNLMLFLPNLLYS
ncbi:MAG: TRAP transporter large permease [Clostridia bacterium]|nr:TRAP transporter large permease [Clostridia bacterium]